MGTVLLILNPKLRIQDRKNFMLLNFETRGRVRLLRRFNGVSRQSCCSSFHLPLFPDVEYLPFYRWE